MIDVRRKFDHRRIHKKFFEQRRVGMKAPMDVLQWGLKKMKPSGLLGLMRIDFT